MATHWNSPSATGHAPDGQQICRRCPRRGLHDIPLAAGGGECLPIPGQARRGRPRAGRAGEPTPLDRVAIGPDLRSLLPLVSAQSMTREVGRKTEAHSISGDRGMCCAFPPHLVSPASLAWPDTCFQQRASIALKEIPVSQALAPPIGLTCPATRWIQLLLGLVCMMAISSPQYVWTLFTPSAGRRAGCYPGRVAGHLLPADRPADVLLAVQGMVGGSLWPAPADRCRRIADRLLLDARGPCRIADHALSELRRAGPAWEPASSMSASSCQMVGWFPDKRGFAAGMLAAGYGFGAIVTTFPIASSIATAGYQATLLQYGALFGAVGFLAALGLKAPPAAAHDDTAPGSGPGY